MLLAGRRGQIFYWNPFDNSSGNFNVCVVGKPGSGKSVFMQELATSILGLGGHIYVLDVGHSFEKQVKFLGGQFIEFGTKSNLCINPFSTINDQDEENVTDSLSILKPIISLMIAPKRGTTDEEDAIIERGLSHVWKKKGKKAGISDLADWLLAEPDNTANNLGNMFFPYSLQGAYGKFFNGEATVNFAAEFVVTELQELKERKDLLAVVVQIFILQMTNKIILGDRSTPTGIVFDELWKLLRGKQGSEFIEELARTLRKYNGSLIVGTQNLSDFYKNPGAEAAFNNSDWLCMFAQKKEAIEILKQSGKFSIDEYTQNLLSSVRTKQGEYSEVMIMHESGSALGRLILDPFSRILYSSKADEFAAVKDLESTGLTLAEAIRKVSEVKYGNAC
jgi:conjugal transfer ATP-binding protein TraC